MQAYNYIMKIGLLRNLLRESWDILLVQVRYGYYTFQEAKLKIKDKNRNLDLVWATYYPDEKWYNYELHLEHENSISAEETLESKLSDIPNLVAINWA
ncbi:unnamed protein product, partial [marine sediment metagenome]